MRIRRRALTVVVGCAIAYLGGARVAHALQGEGAHTSVPPVPASRYVPIAGADGELLRGTTGELLMFDRARYDRPGSPPPSPRASSGQDESAAEVVVVWQLVEGARTQADVDRALDSYFGRSG